MATHSLAQLERLSQQLTRRFKHLEDLMSQSWSEHELIRGDLRDLFTVYVAKWDRVNTLAFRRTLQYNPYLWSTDADHIAYMI